MSDQLSVVQLEILKLCKRGDIEGLKEYFQQISPEDSVYKSCNWTDHFGKSPLQYAIESNKNDLANFFVSEWGCRIDTRDHAGYTALHWTASKGNLQTSQLLVDHGADLTAKTMYGETPCDIAKRMHRSEELIILLGGEKKTNVSSSDTTVEEFLASIELSELLHIFQQECIDMDVLIGGTLTENDLKEIGISKMGHRKKIMMKLGSMNN